MKLSAVVIVKNEEKNIRACLESLSFANEIVVLDSGSQDATQAIAGEFTPHVHARAFDDFAAQKNHAVSLATGDWVLSVDADERVTDALKKEILIRVSEPGGPDAYCVRRRTFFLGKRLRFSGTQSDKPLRLFRKGTGRFEQPIHETFSAGKRVGVLKNPLLHYTTESADRERAKTEFYTGIEAQFLRSRGVRVGRTEEMFRALAVFGRHYVWQLGFLDGRAGFLFAAFSFLYTRRKYQKLRELYRVEALEPEIEKAFDRHAPKLPDAIHSSDSRLAALLEACGEVAGKKMLDVGCGKGRFAAIFAERGAEVTGIDPSEELLKDARKHRGMYLQGSATALPFPEGVFDVVYAVEVIEHLPFLEKSLIEMSRVLKKGGVLVLMDRNRFSLNQKRFLVPNVVIKRWHEFQNHWIYPNNFPFREHWFTRRQVLRLLKKSGLQAKAIYVQSDGEKNCAWHAVFDRLPMARLFILWRAVK